MKKTILLLSLAATLSLPLHAEGPLIPYAFRGVIWYQGESNRGNPRPYQSLFAALITGWRRNWGRGDYPFLFVQLAPFGNKKCPGGVGKIREAQRTRHLLAAEDARRGRSGDVRIPGYTG